MMLYKILLLIVLLNNCSGNAFDCAAGINGVPCSAKTPDEKADEALNDEDFSTAIELLETLIAEDPETYSRYPRLAAAYAGLGGLDIFNITKISGGSGSILAIMGDFLPTPATSGEVVYKQQVIDMGKSVGILNQIPTELRADTTSSRFAASVTLQLILYQSAYSVMYLNQFTFSPKSGTEIDPEQLKTMTEDDAVTIIENLIAAGATAGGAYGEDVQTAINEALAEIDNQPGSTTKEKLSAYAAARGASPTPTPTPTP